MKTKTKKNTLLSGLLGLSLLMVSFSAPRGGEGFEIYLDNKLVLQRFGNQINTVQSLKWESPQSASVLTVKYHHCGRIGKNRNITIKDEGNRILKEWHFPDAAGGSPAMEFKLKEIMGLKKSGIALKLYYSSTELPKARLLARLELGHRAMAKLTLP
ncbi:MAG TPA: hypothetical protein VFX58_18750 [Chitinophagaceae bacterium]|nr:hypothetical protein [Chitinophagaceae bacterium]